MKLPVSMTVNGKTHSGETEPRTLLIYYLREEIGLTGSHVGCDTSNCGACTVLFDGAAVKACTLFAVQASGHEITTIEGVAPDGSLHPLQDAFWNEHGLQCGFCTPGMIMAGLGLLARNPDPSVEEIHAGIEGNLCRCTGYNNIVKSIQTAAQAMRSETSASASD